MKDTCFQQVLNKIYPKQDTRLLFFNIPKRTSHEVYFVNFERKNKQETLVFKFHPEDVPEYKSPSIKKEAYIIGQLKKSNIVEVPNILYEDTNKEIFPKDYFVMELVKGIPMSESIKNATTKEKIKYVRETANIIATVHDIHIELFAELPKEHYANVLIRKHTILYEGLKKNNNSMKDLDFRIIEKSLEYLEKNKPVNNDEALINGDFSPEHFVYTKKGKYTLLDWDPAEIGDRSWDLYWMVKEASEFVFGYKDSLTHLIQQYQKVSHKPLENQEYYKNAAVTWAYLLGWYIEERIPNSHLVNAIKSYRSNFSKRIEELI